MDEGQEPQSPNLELPPGEVLDEIQRINPVLLELAMERVARRHREAEISQLKQTIDSLVAARGGVEDGEAQEDQEGGD